MRLKKSFDIDAVIKYNCRSKINSIFLSHFIPRVGVITL